MSNESAASRIDPGAPSAPSPAQPGPASGAQPEFSLRAVIVGLLVAALIGLLYPYVVLKIGFGPNISVVSAFLGFMLISLIGKLVAPRGNRFEYNIVQTAGTSAGQQGFMVIVLAAFDLLASRNPGQVVSLTGVQIFVWLTLSGVLGVLMAVPLRKHYIDEEQLTFADGVAAGETLIVLDADYKSARRGVLALLSGGIASAVTFIFSQMPKWRILPEEFLFGKWGQRLNVGTSWSLLSIASGMLVGMRITLSMGLGMVLAWFIAPPILAQQHWIPEETFRENLRWIMWPALAMMLTGGLTSLALKWKLLARSFKGVKMGVSEGTDFPMRWVIIGCVLSAVGLVTFQKISLDFSPWLSTLALLVSVPLMVVGTRVLGETNWAPISTFANLVQMLFGGIAGSLNTNMIASGMSGTVAANGEQLMQDYKAGKLIGSNNRYLTYMQLIALPVGSAAVAFVYPLLRSQFGIGPDRYGISAKYAGQVAQGLSAPSSVRWAGVAEAMAHGFSALPPHALTAFWVAAAVGIVFTLLEPRSHWVPSVSSMGLGALIEARFVLPMVIGGVLQYVWGRLNPRQEAELNTPLSSGAIVGEALMVFVLSILMVGNVFEGVVAQPSVVTDWVYGLFLGAVTVALLIYARRSRKPGDDGPVTRTSGGH